MAIGTKEDDKFEIFEAIDPKGPDDQLNMMEEGRESENDLSFLAQAPENRNAIH